MEMMIRYNGVPSITFPINSSFDDIVTAAEKAWAEHPEDERGIVVALTALGCSVQGRQELFIRAADRVLELSTDPEERAQALICKAYQFINTKTRLDEAERLMIEAQATDPDLQQPYETLYDMYTERKEFEKALYWGELMAQQEDMDHIGLELKGRALYELERYPEAIEALKAAIALDLYPSRAYCTLGGCYLNTGEFKAAQKALVTAFEKSNPPVAWYAYGAGCAYLQDDDPYRAMKWFSKALDINPAYPEALNNMAVISLGLEGSWHEAVPYLTRAVELSGEAIKPEMRLVYRNLWAYHKQILDEEKAEYYHRLNLQCLGFDDDTIDFMDDIREE